MAENNAKICVILMWIIWIVGIIWYFVDEKIKKDKFAAFWAKQSIVLFILWIALAIVSSIPVIGWFAWLGYIFVLVLWVIGLISILKDEQKELPVIGQFAKNFKW